MGTPMWEGVESAVDHLEEGAVLRLGRARMVLVCLRLRSRSRRPRGNRGV